MHMMAIGYDVFGVIPGVLSLDEDSKGLKRTDLEGIHTPSVDKAYAPQLGS